MPFVLSCPKCNKSFRVPDSAEGKWVKCSDCGHQFEAKDEIDFASPPPLPQANKAEIVHESELDKTWDVPPISVPAKVPEKFRSQRKLGWIIPFTAGLFTAIFILALIYVSFDANDNGATDENVAVALSQTAKSKGLIDETESFYASRPSHWKPSGKGSYDHTSGITVSFNWKRGFREDVAYNQKLVLWNHNDQNQILVALIVLTNPGQYIKDKEVSDELDSRLEKWLRAGYPGVLSFAGLKYEAGPSINGMSSFIISED